MDTVFVYKNSNGDYKVHPAVVVVNGGGKLRVVNCSDETLTITLPAGASDPNNPVSKQITPQDRADFDAREQGKDKTKSFNYTAVTATLIAAQGNSDPVLIIEN